MLANLSVRGESFPSRNGMDIPDGIAPLFLKPGGILTVPLTNPQPGRSKETRFFHLTQMVSGLAFREFPGRGGMAGVSISVWARSCRGRGPRERRRTSRECLPDNWRTEARASFSGGDAGG
ncbi:MAG: hypothetical protein LBQ12_11670 [Deltaproteobacteria bacterium]|jgi:hypothetical protein|nr:hypothetical protein [Deltaproteobacteria bacterium]